MLVGILSWEAGDSHMLDTFQTLVRFARLAIVPSGCFSIPTGVGTLVILGTPSVVLLFSRCGPVEPCYSLLGISAYARALSGYPCAVTAMLRNAIISHVAARTHKGC